MRACTVPSGDSIKSVVGDVVISQNLSLEKSSDKVRVSAKLGAFAKGKVVLKNKDGDAICDAQEVSQSKGVVISAEFDLSKISEIDEVILEYFNGKHTLTIEKIKL